MPHWHVDSSNFSAWGGGGKSRLAKIWWTLGVILGLRVMQTVDLIYITMCYYFYKLCMTNIS